jgi:hypothetical protein
MYAGGFERGAVALKLRALVLVALTIVVSGCGGATASPSPVVAEDSSGPFRLELKLSRPDWHATESIPGEATLSLVGMDTLTYGSTSSGPIIFRFKEIGGNREFVEPSTADCRQRTLDADKPVVVPIRFPDPTLELPVGTWRITADAQADANGICPHAGLSVSVEGQVIP